jgi:hypothetical protein
MSDKEQESLDILGVKPIGEAVNTAVKSTFDGAGAFLGRICLPAAEEFGLLLRDRVSMWRKGNVTKILDRAEANVRARRVPEGLRAHPRIVSAVLEQGSWADQDAVQEMWAGLLASSCTEVGDDSNLVYVNLLSQLTSKQATFLNTLCELMPKEISSGGTIGTKFTYYPLSEVMAMAGATEYHDLHLDLNHMTALNLLYFHLPEDFDLEAARNAVSDSTQIEGSVAPLGLYLYVRCQGFIGSPVEYFGLTGAEES